MNKLCTNYAKLKIYVKKVSVGFLYRKKLIQNNKMYKLKEN